MNLEADGFEIMHGLVSDSVISNIVEDVSSGSEQVPRGGIRNANKKYPTIDALARDTAILGVAHLVLEGRPRLVRAIYFDKTPERNWLVSWHQDRTIVVDRRIEIEGWGPWSVKAGMDHVQPPIEVLNMMVTIRVHLDAAGEDNGCLKVIPGSHKFGLIESKDVTTVAEANEAYACKVEMGDAVVMRPHILHSSSKASRPEHRRVVHLEYSSYQLPGELSWLD